MLIHLIGPVKTELNGKVHRFNAPKIACVLATLAADPGQPVDLPTLFARLWGDDPPNAAISVLYSYMARLRAMFRDTAAVELGRAGRRGYVLDTDPDNIDIHALRGLVGEAAALAGRGNHRAALPLWRRAAELATGEALVGVEGDWAAEYRARFHRERLRLLTGRFDAELRLGHHAAVVDEIAEHVAREPFAEPLVEHLILALYRCGRAAEALDQYETTRLALRDRLGTDPSPRLKELHRRILNQDPALTVRLADTAPPVHTATTARAPAQLPPTTTAFTGRVEALNAIVTQRAERPVVVIDGMAGVGKTALAVHAAHKLAPEYPDGQLFIDLRGYTDGVLPLTPEQAVSQLLRALDVEIPDDVVDRTGVLRTALAGRRILLLADNAQDTEQVRPLIPGSADCLTIVTSRNRLVDLVEARPVSLDVLPPAAAAEVFTAEAELDTTERDEVPAIVEACGRLPLALRIAASRLRNRPTWSAADLLRRLTTSPAGLRELDAAGRGVVAAFDLSYRDLDPVEQRVFRLLSVFPGPEFDRQIAATLAAVDTSTADVILEKLVDSHLVIATAAERFRLHDLMRRYAADATEDPERDEAWRRLADMYLWVGRHAVDLVSPQLVEWPGLVNPSSTATIPTDLPSAEGWLHRNIPVFEPLVRTAADRGLDDYVLELCTVAQSFLVRYGGFESCLRLATLGAEAATRLGVLDQQAHMYDQAAASHIALSEFAAAVPYLNEALRLFDEAGMPGRKASPLNNLARIHAVGGDDRSAVTTYLRAIDVATELDDLGGEGIVHINIAGPLCRLGRLEEATRHIDRAEEIFNRLGASRQRMRVVYYRGVILSARGEHDAAIPLFQRVVDYCREHNMSNGLAPTFARLADAHLEVGRTGDAIDAIDQQLKLLDTAPSEAERSVALVQLGRAQAVRGELDEAIGSMRAGLALAEEVDARRVRAAAQRVLGSHLAEHGDPTEAVELLTEATEFYVEAGYPEAVELRRRLDEVRRYPPRA